MVFLQSWPRDPQYELYRLWPQKTQLTIQPVAQLSPILSTGKHASHQLPSNSRALWASLKHKVLCSVKPACSLPPHSQIYQGAYIPYSPTNRSPALLNRHLCVLQSPQAQTHFKACRRYDHTAITLKIII